VAASDDLSALLTEAGVDPSNAADRRALCRILGCADNDDDALARRLLQARALAFKEWVDWANAVQRFSSLSELDMFRVLNLFLKVRQTAPSVEALVEELAIPQGRATSMIGRMKYGQARELMRLSYQQAAADVQNRVNDAKEDVHHRKAIVVSREIVDRLQAIDYEIFSLPSRERTKGGRFESAERIGIQPSGRYGATVTASKPMWQYLIAELNRRANP
jgi:hypothetical protein